MSLPRCWYVNFCMSQKLRKGWSSFVKFRRLLLPPIKREQSDSATSLCSRFTVLYAFIVILHETVATPFIRLPKCTDFNVTLKKNNYGTMPHVSVLRPFKPHFDPPPHVKTRDFAWDYFYNFAPPPPPPPSPPLSLLLLLLMMYNHCYCCYMLFAKNPKITVVLLWNCGWCYMVITLMRGCYFYATVS